MDQIRRADASTGTADFFRTVHAQTGDGAARGLHAASSSRPTAIAGLTVAIVALPLSMAIAIASGVTPERGLYTAIVGGFIVSALGGSRFQIGGPAGAFIVLVAATVGASRRRRAAAGDDDVRRLPARHRLSQARHLHQIHPLSGDGRLHRRHRRHHLLRPDRRTVRAEACRQGARAAGAEADGARRGGRHDQPLGDAAWRC